MNNHDLTDIALDNLERELVALPVPQSAYCADAVDSLRFHLHVHAAATIAELKRRRADDATLRAVANEALDGWEAWCLSSEPGATPSGLAKSDLERISKLRKLVTP